MADVAATSTRSLSVFGKDDIGGELLPILTIGLYRDRLDTLREYIQNAIDAEASAVEITISPDVISVRDDGSGMTEVSARQAIRLGVSQKNPLESVGFRGIGIYSAFNICDALEIHTRSPESPDSFTIEFDFRGMRDLLLHEAERRKRNYPPGLSLESLLEQTVTVTKVPGAQRPPGTLAIFQGILPDAYEQLRSWDRVAGYIADVVPLPFDPHFKFQPELEAAFADARYRVVQCRLQIGIRAAQLFRPLSARRTRTKLADGALTSSIEELPGLRGTQSIFRIIAEPGPASLGHAVDKRCASRPDYLKDVPQDWPVLGPRGDVRERPFTRVEPEVRADNVGDALSDALILGTVVYPRDVMAQLVSERLRTLALLMRGDDRAFRRWLVVVHDPGRQFRWVPHGDRHPPRWPQTTRVLPRALRRRRPPGRARCVRAAAPRRSG